MVGYPFIDYFPSALSFQIAAFEYQFGALDNKQDKLREVMQNLE
jgi:hypothetical protein